MQYNFDEIIDRRNTNALNTDGFRGYIFHAGPEKVFPFKDEEFTRMWVADMLSPGHGKPFAKEELGGWCEKRYGWSFKQEELCFSPGIIPALYQLVEDLIGEGETFVITTPSYGYFLHAAEYNNVPVLCSDLINTEDGWTIDFDDLEKKCADPRVKMLLWCNPHNPTGRIWTEEELKRVAEIVEKHDLWLVSDEIHCDLIRQGLCHIPMGKIMPDYKKLITCMSASKTFNMAGLMFSDIIIRDQAEREHFNGRDKIAGMLNPLSIVAHQAAYEQGEEWLDQLKAYLDGNFRYVADFLAKRLPDAGFRIPEATYLAWVDLSKCLPDVEDLPGFFANEAGVLLEGGNSLFVGNAEGFVRLNLAMPRSILETGMERIADSVERHGKGLC